MAEDAPHCTVRVGGKGEGHPCLPVGVKGRVDVALAGNALPEDHTPILRSRHDPGMGQTFGLGADAHKCVQTESQEQTTQQTGMGLAILDVYTHTYLLAVA